MLATYRSAFQLPGTARFCAAAFVMRLPLAIYPLGLVLIVSAHTGRYGFAGVLAGIYVAANGVGNPVLARLVDRLGQRRVLVPASAVHAAAALVLGVLVQSHAPQWSLIPAAVVLGFTYLSVGSLVRARWSYVLAGRPELGTAYSLESILDEAIFTLGPLIATLIATQTEPVLVLVVAVGLVLIGALWLRRLTDTEPPALPAGAPRGRTALAERGMVLLSLAAVAMGGIFSSAEVTMVAFAGQHGSRGASGFALAAFALGSGVSGLAYGARAWSSPVADRFRVQALIFGLLPVIFFAATNVWVLTACAFAVGLGIAPTLITAFSLIDQLVRPAALTEGLAWLSTGISIGYGAGSSVVGGIADAHGARPAFSVTVACGLVMAALAAALRMRLTGQVTVGESARAALP